MAFFDKIGQTITNGVTTVSDSTKSIAGTSKLNSQINADKNSIKKTYEEMGQFYYNHRGEDLPKEALDGMCAEIDRLNAEIHELELKVKLAKGFVPCSNCGSDVSINSTFCANCGTRVTVPAPNMDDVPIGKKKCLKCGNIEDSDTKFCSSCGTKMPEETSTTAPKAETRVCLKCGITMPAEMKFCANCGTKFDEEPPVEEAAPVDNASEETGFAAVIAEEATAETNAAVAENEAPTQPEAVPEEKNDVQKCASCGAEIADGSKFCMQCGTPIAAAIGSVTDAAVSPADSKVCSKCGKVEPLNMSFCSECGNKL